MSTNFELQEYVIFFQSTKITTHENKAIQSIPLPLQLTVLQSFIKINNAKMKLSM